MNEKKYTVEDNIKSMMFSLKDLVKKLDQVINILEGQSAASEKSDDKNDLPF